jgi:hypothetical protein
MEVRKYAVAATFVATLAASASAAYLREDIHGSPRYDSINGVALKADEGVPKNLVTAMKADEGVPQNLMTAPAAAAVAVAALKNPRRRFQCRSLAS